MNFGHSCSLLLRALLTFDPLDWVHEMSWYQDMLNSQWFAPIRPVWINYHLDWVVAGLLLLLLLLLLWLLFKLVRWVARGVGRTGESRAAADLLAQGDRKLAAETYVQCGELQKAFDLYLQEGMLFQAAQLSEKLGREAEAADLYEKAKDPVSAARVLERIGELDRAAALYRRLDRLVDAARMYQEAGKLREAGALYRELGMLVKAATVLSEAGETLTAAECLLEYARHSSGGFTSEESDMLVNAAAVLRKAGKPAESAILLMATGQFEGAGQHYLDAGDKQKASECFEKAGKLRRAADLCENKVHRLQIIERMRQEGVPVPDREYAEALAAAGQHDRAAATFQNLNDLEAAVRVNIGGGHLSEAAALLAKKGQYSQAAKLFEDAGDLAAAREQYLLAGDWKAAAGTALRMGQFFEAGGEFYAHDDLARAVDCLQRVPPDHARFREASSLLARCFEKLSDPAMAQRMHLRATEHLKVDRDNMELFYEMARFLEATGRAEDRRTAKRIFGDILAVQYTFKDTKARFDKLSE